MLPTRRRHRRSEEEEPRHTSREKPASSTLILRSHRTRIWTFQIEIEDLFIVNHSGSIEEGIERVGIG